MFHFLMLCFGAYYAGSSPKNATSSSQRSYICYGTRKRNNEILIIVQGVVKITNHTPVTLRIIASQSRFQGITCWNNLGSKLNAYTQRDIITGTLLCFGQNCTKFLTLFYNAVQISWAPTLFPGSLLFTSQGATWDVKMRDPGINNQNYQNL